MKILVKYPSLLLTYWDHIVVIDDHWLAQSLALTSSPWYLAQLRYGEQWFQLFPLYSPYNPCFYWKEPPLLLLPERAESLTEWSHCIFCGMPLDDSSFCLAESTKLEQLIEEVPLD